MTDEFDEFEFANNRTHSLLYVTFSTRPCSVKDFEIVGIEVKKLMTDESDKFDSVY